MSEPETPTPREVMAMSEYVVLKQIEGGWHQVSSEVAARGATAAIRQTSEKTVDADGTYVAIPKRSWKPVKVKAEQTVTLKLEDA